MVKIGRTTDVVHKVKNPLQNGIKLRATVLPKYSLRLPKQVDYLLFLTLSNLVGISF